MPRELDQITGYGETKKWYDYVKAYEFDDASYRAVRPIGPVWTDYRHVVTTKNGKRYYEYCQAWDTEKDDFVDDREAVCECCRLQSLATLGIGGSKITGQYRYFMNIIDMSTEESKPANAKPDWTPVFLLEMSTSLFRRIQELKAVNKSFPVTHPENGAIIAIKFDKDLDAANMYSATMDTKTTPLTADQRQYIAVQKYPDGTSQVKKGDGKRPGLFDYVRTTSSREEMRRSLRSHGYYQNEAQPTVSAAPRLQASGYQDFSRQDEVDFGVAEVDEETTVSSLPAHLKNVSPSVAKDEEPAPRPKAAATAPPKQAAPTLDDLRAGASMGCPTEFGQFAQVVECFTNCGVFKECRTHSEQQRAAPSAQTKRPAPVQLDDDDAV